MHWLKEYIDYKGYSILYFEKSIGTRSTIDKAIKNSSNLRGNILAKIIETYPDINPKWLITGKGKMLILETEMNSLEFYEKLNIPNLLNYLLDNNSDLIKDQSFRDYIQIKATQLGLEKAMRENDVDLEKLRQEALDKYRKKD